VSQAWGSLAHASLAGSTRLAALDAEGPRAVTTSACHPSRQFTGPSRDLGPAVRSFRCRALAAISAVPNRDRGEDPA
jgi:hypothetical protein